MKYTKILLLVIVTMFVAASTLQAQVASMRYTIGEDTNNEISDSVDFDRNAPILTEGDGKLYYIRHINLHGVKYLNHDILKSSAGLQEGDSIYLPSKFISNAMQRLWAPRYFSNIQIGATIEGALSLFCDRIGVHMSGLLFARRTVDEKPPEARSNICFSSFSLSSTVSASANDVTCDIWDT